MVTVVDVARAAGVSTATVSHVLNGTRPVHPATATRVHEAIAQSGYTPHSGARALKTARTQTIAVALPDIANPFFIDIVRGAEEEARAAGYTLLLANAVEDVERQLQEIQGFAERRVDGLILSLTARGKGEALAAVRRHRIPAVLVDRLSEEGIDQVGVDGRQPTRDLVDHLMGLGHRRIGFVTGLADLGTMQERLDGYRDALEQAGIPVDDRLVVQGMTEGELHKIDITSESAVVRLLDEASPTAIVAGNYLMSLGTLRALRRRARMVPGDIALVAYDDFPWADLLESRLTTMAQPALENSGGRPSFYCSDGWPTQRRHSRPSASRRSSCIASRAGARPMLATPSHLRLQATAKRDERRPARLGERPRSSQDWSLATRSSVLTQSGMRGDSHGFL